MKRSHTIIFTLSVIIFFAFAFQVSGQRQPMPDKLVGADLDEVQQEYSKLIDEGADSLIIPYAEALYYDDKFDEALSMFRVADSLGIPLNKYQQRNFSHAAKRLNQQSPYDQDTGYFSTDWQSVVEISDFCDNSPQEDFAPFVWHDLLFVTSSRTTTARGRERYLFTRLPFLNIHVFDKECRSIEPAFLPSSLTSDLHDGPLTIARDTSIVLITRNYEKPNEDGIQNLYLGYYVKDKNSNWSREIMFPFNDVAYSIQHPYFDDSSNTLYFSSDMPGGHGGFDLYKSTWDGTSWGDPQNLGPEINTSYDEVFPSLSPQGDLIYASNHIETTGGLDLVMFRDNIRYLFPEPFNTVYDDFSITFKNETSGYFASGRDAEGFNDNIYLFEIKGPPWPAYDFYAEVLDQETDLPVEDVMVSFSSESAEDNILTSEEGMAFLHSGRREPHEYHFQLSKEGYQPKEVISADFSEREGVFVTTLYLKEIVDPIEEEILAQGYFEVFFDNDRPDPGSRNPVTSLDYRQTYDAYLQRKDDYYRNSSNTKEELDQFFDDVEQGMEQLEWFAGYLKEEMSQSRNYTIIFTAHASPLASSEYNMILSQRRFDSVENYLKDWEHGSLQEFIDMGKLDYENIPLGDLEAQPGVSSDRRAPAQSIYSVEAARERRVTITWRIVYDDDGMDN